MQLRQNDGISPASPVAPGLRADGLAYLGRALKTMGASLSLAIGMSSQKKAAAPAPEPSLRS